jgi:hypothetical protein
LQKRGERGDGVCRVATECCMATECCAAKFIIIDIFSWAHQCSLADGCLKPYI